MCCSERVDGWGSDSMLPVWNEYDFLNYKVFDLLKSLCTLPSASKFWYKSMKNILLKFYILFVDILILWILITIVFYK
jgi:hypothetical protein